MSNLLHKAANLTLVQAVRRTSLAALKIASPLYASAPSVSPMPSVAGRLICGKVPTDFRDFQRVEGVEAWCRHRGVSFECLSPEMFAGTDWSDCTLLWMPFLNPGEDTTYEDRCQQLQNVPETVPLALDIKSCTSHPWLDAIAASLSGRKMACRVVSPHDTRGLFQIQEQYGHYPVPLPPAPEKDVLVVDIHKWEDSLRHFQVLAFLVDLAANYDEACSVAGHQLKVYLTSFTTIAPYSDALSAFEKHAYGTVSGSTLGSVRENLIAPAPTREGFREVLGRARLFVTFHNNLTDMLLFEALANEIPTAILRGGPSAGHHQRLWVPERNRNLSFRRWVLEAEESLVDLEAMRDGFAYLRLPPQQLDSQRVLKNVYLQVWDRLWEWAVSLRQKQQTGETVTDAVMV